MQLFLGGKYIYNTGMKEGVNNTLVTVPEKNLGGAGGRGDFNHSE